MQEQGASTVELTSNVGDAQETQQLSPSDGVHGNDYFSLYELPSPVPTSKSLSPKVATPSRSHSRSPIQQKLPSSVEIIEPKTAEDYLTMGIEAHLIESPEALSQSAEFFEISAKLNGGTPFGMLMWGLCLRHGWGVPIDERKGFIWLRRACEIAVGDLEGLQIPSARERSSPERLPAITQGVLTEVKAELVLAIYEVGQCFFQGWGVTRDRKLGFVS
jgi:hypothetical protein